VKHYLVCFDISEDKIRRRIGLLLERYGERIQYSVFEIVVRRNSELDKLKEKIDELLEPGDDLRFYFLNKDTLRQSFACNEKPMTVFPAAIVV